MRKSIVGAVTLAAATGLASLGVAAIGESAHGVGDVCVNYSGVSYAQFGSASCTSSPGGNVAVGLGSASNATSFGTNNTTTAVSGTNFITNASATGSNNTTTIVNNRFPVITGIGGGTNNTVTSANCAVAINGMTAFLC